jgi:hypothetical protein
MDRAAAINVKQTGLCRDKPEADRGSAATNLKQTRALPR